MSSLRSCTLALALAALPASVRGAGKAPIFPDAQDDSAPGQPCCAFSTQRPGAEVVAFYERHLGAKALGPDQVAARYPAHAQQMAMVGQMSGGGRRTWHFVLAEQGSGAGKSAVLLTVNEIPALGTIISVPEAWVARGAAGPAPAGKPQPASRLDVAAKGIEQQVEDLERQDRAAELARVKGLPLARKEDYDVPVPDGARRETGQSTHHRSRHCYGAIPFVMEPYARVAPPYEKLLRGVLPLLSRGDAQLEYGEQQFAVRFPSEVEGRVPAEVHGKKGAVNRTVSVSPHGDAMTRVELSSTIADETCALADAPGAVFRKGPIPEGLRRDR